MASQQSLENLGLIDVDERQGPDEASQRVEPADLVRRLAQCQPDTAPRRAVEWEEVGRRKINAAPDPVPEGSDQMLINLRQLPVDSSHEMRVQVARDKSQRFISRPDVSVL